MYNVSIKNNYIYSLFQDGGNQIIAGPNGGTAFLQNWGSHVLNVRGMGDINFIDIADKKLPNYTNPKLPWTNATWGGLVPTWASRLTSATKVRGRSSSWWTSTARSVSTSHRAGCRSACPI